MVDIRKTELQLRDKQIDQDQQQFESKQNQRADEKLLENEILKKRIDVQKGTADAKLDLASKRLEQQANLKLLELEQKMRG